MPRTRHQKNKADEKRSKATGQVIRKRDSIRRVGKPTPRLKELLDFRPQTANELQTMIQHYFGIWLPDKPICQQHQAPLDFMADAFFMNEPRTSIVMGPRGGGKTTMLSLTFLIDAVFHDNCEIADVGAIAKQAKRAYKYFTTFGIDTDTPFHDAITRSIQSETNFINGSMLEVVTGTAAGLNSPHPQRGNCDEADLMTWNLIQEFLMMMQSKNELASQARIVSTRKTKYGPMHRAIKKREELGFHLYQWCVLDVSAKCRRASCEDCKKTMKGEGEDRVNFHDICQGRLQEATGHVPIADTLGKFRTLDLSTFRAQLLCQEPGTQGLYFPEYMDKPGLPWSHHIKDFDMSTVDRYILSCDPSFGYSVIIFWAITEPKLIAFHEIVTKQLSPTQLISTSIPKDIKALGIHSKPEMIVSDPKNPSFIADLEVAGYTAVACPINSVNIGIQTMHSMLRPSPKSTLVHVYNCPQLNEMLPMYHKKETRLGSNEYLDLPAKDEPSHYADAARYAICYQWHEQIEAAQAAADQAYNDQKPPPEVLGEPYDPLADIDEQEF